jgi:hypothetical protein
MVRAFVYSEGLIIILVEAMQCRCGYPNTDYFASQERRGFPCTYRVSARDANLA